VETVRCLLRDLFRQVLSERGRETLALTGIGIESSDGPFDPRLVAYFSNGNRVEVAVRTADLYEFCERHSTWDLDGLRCALASEGREIYAQLVHGLQAEVGGPHPLHVETPEPDTTGRLRAWWNRQRFIRGHHLEQAVEREAHDRGLRLLINSLSPAQRAQYDAFGYFEVIGGETGKRYRITKAYQMNVLEMGKNGKRTQSLCFVPKGGLVLGDVMLAQKLALELFESHALAVANAVIGRASPIFPMG
jgi:hypothetical protein